MAEQNVDPVGNNDVPQGANERNLERPVAGIKPPQSLCIDSNVSTNWKLFKQKWHNYAIITYLDRQPVAYQTALLLHTLGDEALKIHNGFQFATPEEQRTTAEIIQSFDNYAVGEVNETYERYVFHTRKQEESESMEAYIAALRTLIKTCNYCDNCLNSVLRDQIVLGIRNPETQAELLKVRNIGLQNCIDICKLSENAAQQSRALRPDTVNKISFRSRNKQPRSVKQNKDEKKSCKFCTSQHEMKKELCPAYGKTCAKCKGRNHFAARCKASKKRIHAVHAECDSDKYSTEYEPIDSVTTKEKINKLSLKMIKAEMEVEGKSITFQLDSGASVNLLNVKYAKTVDLQPSSKTLVMWNGTEMKPLGECRLKVVNPKNGGKYAVKFVIVEDLEDLHPLLGATAIQKMGLITINKEEFNMVAGVKHDENKDELINQYQDVFSDELGSLPGMVHLETNPSITPHISPARRVPVAIKPKLEAELQRLVEKDVIEPVSEPTNWVSGLALVVKKNGKLRICIDPKPLNKALRREHFHLPVLDDLLPDLADVKVFSTLDLRDGFWHLKLDEESSRLTTFATPFGRYRWKVLPFGIAPAPEIFQKNVYNNVSDLPGVLNKADDLLVCGKGKTMDEAIIDHDLKLRKLLDRCRERGMRLNPDKLKLRQTSLSFMGHLVTSEGLCPDPEKVRAIEEMPRPTDVAGVQRLGGFVNYLAKFLPKISEVMAPIRNLTKADVPWTWSEVQEQAFERVKQMVTKAPVLRYYDMHKPLVIQCDASEKGLGAALLQEDHPLAYVSRALTDTETRYAQIEKELLAVVYACERFHQYTFGQHVTVLSDHRPLEAIAKKELVNCPKRLQNMLMRLQRYDVSIVYHPGKKMYLADTLSRAFINNVECYEDDDPKETDYIPIEESRISELRAATREDHTMQQLQRVILRGWPDDKHLVTPEVRPYFSFRNEMTVQDGLIFRGDRVVVPENQRSILKQRLHSSHIGVEGCCRRARECLYWPNMNSEIREHISKCPTCRKFEIANPKEPLLVHEVPERPWAKIGVDLFSFGGRDYMCTVDYMSNFWEVDHLPSTEAKPVITKLKSHFARYGIPDQVVSDNGPQFSSSEFATFAKKWCFAHTPTSPYNSKANGKVEAAVKMAKNLFRKAKDDMADPYLAMLDHRNTPSKALLSPAQKFMSRRTKTLLPTTESLLKPSTQRSLKDINKKEAKKQEEYFNRKVQPLQPLKPGDVVRVKPYVKGDKIWKKATVLERLDTRSYHIDVGGEVRRRNRFDLKKTAETAPFTPYRSQQIPPPVEQPEPSRSSPSKQAPPSSPPQLQVISPETPKAVTSASTVAPQTPVRKTRSGRVVRTPLKLRDFSQ